MLNVNKIFRGRKAMSEEDMRSGIVVGGPAALAEKLRVKHGWDGRSLLAAPLAVLEMGSIVDNFWSVLGELKDLSFAASHIWVKGDKDLKVGVKMEDLTMFDFKANNREGKGGNLSDWLKREDLEVVYTNGKGDEVSFEEAVKKHGISEFVMRLLVVPTSHVGASVWVGVSPYSKEELVTKLGNEANSHLVPHITVQIQASVPHGVKTAARAAHAMFSMMEQPKDMWGFGCIPWLDATADGEEGVMLPTSDEFKESTLRHMRQSTASAATTSAANMETRMAGLVAGKPTPPKNLPQVFPEFCGAENAKGPKVG